MIILSIDQNVGQLLKITDQTMIKKLDYQIYREFIQTFLENLKERIKNVLLAVVLYDSVQVAL